MQFGTINYELKGEEREGRVLVATVGRMKAGYVHKFLHSH